MEAEDEWFEESDVAGRGGGGEEEEGIEENGDNVGVRLVQQ